MSKVIETDNLLKIDGARYEREEHNHKCNRLGKTLASVLELIIETGVALSCEERAVIDELAGRAVAAKERVS